MFTTAHQAPPAKAEPRRPPSEVAAEDRVAEAAQAVRRAIEAFENAGYGSLVTNQLRNALKEIQHVHYQVMP